MSSPAPSLEDTAGHHASRDIESQHPQATPDNVRLERRLLIAKRLLFFTITLSLGTVKTVFAFKGEAVLTNTLDFIIGVPLAIIFYVMGEFHELIMQLILNVGWMKPMTRESTVNDVPITLSPLGPHCEHAETQTTLESCASGQSSPPLSSATEHRDSGASAPSSAPRAYNISPMPLPSGQIPQGALRALQRASRTTSRRCVRASFEYMRRRTSVDTSYF